MDLRCLCCNAQQVQTLRWTEHSPKGYWDLPQAYNQYSDTQKIRSTGSHKSVMPHIRKKTLRWYVFKVCSLLRVIWGHVIMSYVAGWSNKVSKINSIQMGPKISPTPSVVFTEIKNIHYIRGLIWSVTIRKKICWRCLRTGHWGEYLELTATEIVAGEWRKIHKQKHHNFQSSHNNRTEIKKGWDGQGM